MNEDTKKNAWLAMAKDKTMAGFGFLGRTIGPALWWGWRKILSLWRSGTKGKAVCIGAVILLVWFMAGGKGGEKEDSGRGGNVRNENPPAETPSSLLSKAKTRTRIDGNVNFW